MANMSFPHIYPDPESRALRTLLAEECGVPVENILVGCGADELIDLLMRCVLQPGDCIVDSPPTFGMYRFDADINDARTVDVPRLEDFSIDVEGVEAAVAEHSPKMVFLTSPNNPDGSMLKVRRFPTFPCLSRFARVLEGHRLQAKAAMESFVPLLAN
jgi:histidinol-phosphate aminotransferase